MRKKLLPFLIFLVIIILVIIVLTVNTKRTDDIYKEVADSIVSSQNQTAASNPENPENPGVKEIKINIDTSCRQDIDCTVIFPSVLTCTPKVNCCEALCESQKKIYSDARWIGANQAWYTQQLNQPEPGTHETCNCNSEPISVFAKAQCLNNKCEKIIS